MWLEMVPEKIEWYFHTFERHHRLRRTHHPIHFIGESANDPDSNCTGYMYVCVWELVDITCVRAHFITFWKLNCHYYGVIMGTIASQSPALRLFAPQFIQTLIKENIKVPRHWPLCGEFTGTGEFPAQMASNAENVSIWWRHHVGPNY